MLRAIKERNESKMLCRQVLETLYTLTQGNRFWKFNKKANSQMKAEDVFIQLDKKG